jgi:hypothetical protein
MKIVMPTVGTSRSAETQDGGKGKREALGQHGQVRLKYRNLGLNLLSLARLSQVSFLHWFELFQVPRSIARNRSAGGAKRLPRRRTTPMVRDTSGFRIGRVTMMG